MFERYTEKARRAIFFARYEASQFGSPSIETEHLLLGLLRENKGLASRIAEERGRNLPGRKPLREDEALVNRLLESRASMEFIRKQIEARTPIREKGSTSVDLPLSEESKRVLVYAAEEATRLDHQHVGTEHLVLGLLREEKCFAAEILRGCGFNLDKARAELAEVPQKPEEHVPKKKVGRPEAAAALFERALRRDALFQIRLGALCSQFNWEQRPCEPQDALRHRETRRISLYRGGLYDPAQFEVVKAGWTHYNCAICCRELFEANHPEHSFGYTNGQDWLCSGCYEDFAAKGP